MAKREPKQSRLGIASFSIAMSCLAGWIGMVAYWALRPDEPGLQDSDIAAALSMGALIVLVFLALLVALGLAIAGLVQKRRRRHLAVAGFIIAGTVLLLPLMH